MIEPGRNTISLCGRLELEKEKTYSSIAKMDISNLSYADRQKMVNLIEQKQVKDFMQLYSNLVDRCFNDCINDFTSKAVSGKEVTTRCVVKVYVHLTLSFPSISS